MQTVTISLITVAYNADKTLESCVRSVMGQDHTRIQYIIVDGNSSDNTLEIINRYKDRIDIIVSEPDQGIYDAMNKGIALATGDIIGVLNADDYFADDKVISAVAAAFADAKIDAVYGNLDYTQVNGAISRKWRSKPYRPGLFNFGWMPPHPTFYCRKSVFDRLGYYDLQYGTAADYELMLRFIHHHRLNIKFLPLTMVKMTVGGVSNKSPANRLKAWLYDYKAMCDNGVVLPALAIVCKPLRKILQYIS